MKRIRKYSNTGVFLFEVADAPKIKRERLSNNSDPFVLKNKGKDIIEILQSFLNERKIYINSKYSSYKGENKKLVLLELDLYLETLKRLSIGIEKGIIKK